MHSAIAYLAYQDDSLRVALNELVDACVRCAISDFMKEIRQVGGHKIIEA
jgi:hypothetical protein